MKDVLVTVICTAYNHEKYIKKALDSFVMQKTNFGFEVLVHDDASTDKTADIICEYEKKYPDIIKPIYQKENQSSQNISIVQSFLLPKANGKYIALCEGDDFWISENKLQMQYDVMEQNSSCVACFCKVKRCSEDESQILGFYPCCEIEKSILKPTDFSELQFVKTPYVFQTSGYFFKREIMEYSYCTEYRKYMNGDEAMLRTAIASGDVYYINQSLSCYRWMSMGSWNDRVRNESIVRKINRIYKMIIGDMIFDQTTNYQFHKDIEIAIERNRESIPDVILEQSSSKEEMLSVLRFLNISFMNFLKRVNMKQKIKMILLFYFPHFWNYYKEQKNVRGHS